MHLQIALTGGIASGKSSASLYFQSLGVSIVDADLISRELVSPGSYGLTKITKHFGTGILDNDGELNRAELRKIIFSKPEQRNWLNNLLHPLIHQEMQRQRESAAKSSRLNYTISDIPLLVETEQAKEFDRVLVIDCPESIQIERLMARDNCSESAAKKVLANQASREQRLAIADDIIINNKDLHSLQQNVINLHHSYSSLKSSK